MSDPLHIMRHLIAKAEKAQFTASETIMAGGAGDDRHERAMDTIGNARREFNALAQVLFGADLTRIERAFQ